MGDLHPQEASAALGDLSRKPAQSYHFPSISVSLFRLLTFLAERNANVPLVTCSRWHRARRPPGLPRLLCGDVYDRGTQILAWEGRA